MYHSITFGDKNTYDDWHLIPSSRPCFAPPGVKTKILQVPGGSRRLDYTDSLLGRPSFENRQGSIEFVVEEDESFDWNIIYEEMLKYLHGRKMKAILEDDPLHYYEGRFTVDSRKSDKYYPSIVIGYSVYPYKHEVYRSDGSILWDLITFEPDMMLRDSTDLSVNGILCVDIPGSYEVTIPELICETEAADGIFCVTTKTKHTFRSADEFWVFYNSAENDVLNEFTIHSGSSLNRRFKIGADDIHFVAVGTGTLSILYRGGSL